MEHSPKAPLADYESTPLTRQEYISAVVHLYRGELDRATTWRVRLDATTNWAVLTTAGLLSFSFGQPEHSHVLLLIGLVLICVFWGFEARRYRYADVWYSRVRKIEENFYGPILRRDPVSPEREWGRLVADDLFHPTFKISRFQALRVRLLRNYWAIFLVVILAWVIKVFVHPSPARTWLEVKQRLAVEPLAPWWVAPLGLGLFLVGTGALALFGPRARRDAKDWSLSP